MTLRKLFQLLLCIGAFSLTLLLLLARYHWLLEILTHFRLPFAVVLILLTTWYLIQKRWLIGSSFLLCLILQVIPLSHHFLPFGKDSRTASGPELTILTFNVLSQNPNHDDVLAYLRASEADIICLQEVTAQWARNLDKLKGHYSHRISRPREDNFGLLLLSKHPISHYEFTDEKLGTPYLKAIIDWQSIPLTVVNAHPPPPIGKKFAHYNRRTLQQIHHHATEVEGAVIITGDLNCTAYAPSFQPLRRVLYDSARGRGYAATWRRGHPLFGLAIDHILYSSDLVCLDRQIGPRNGSDHSPVIARFRSQSSP